MKCEKLGNHTISYQSLLLSTTVLNDTVLNDIANFITIITGAAQAAFIGGANFRYTLT